MKKLIIISLFILLVLSFSMMVFAEENSQPGVQQQRQELSTVSKNVYGTVSKGVYGAREGYIVSVTDTELVLGKVIRKNLTERYTFKIGPNTKVVKVFGKKSQALTIKDLKPGMKVVVRFKNPGNQAVSIMILFDKKPQVVPAEIKKLMEKEKERIRKMKEKAKEKINKIKEDAAKKLDKAKEEIKKIRERERERIEKMKQIADKKVEKVKEQVERIKEQTREQMEKMKEKMTGQENEKNKKIRKE